MDKGGDTYAVLFYALWGKQRAIGRKYLCTTIATIADLLHLTAPNGAIGKAIKAVVKQWQIEESKFQYL